LPAGPAPLALPTRPSSRAGARRADAPNSKEAASCGAPGAGRQCRRYGMGGKATRPTSGFWGAVRSSRRSSARWRPPSKRRGPRQGAGLALQDVQVVLEVEPPRLPAVAAGMPGEAVPPIPDFHLARVHPRFHLGAHPDGDRVGVRAHLDTPRAIDRGKLTSARSNPSAASGSRWGVSSCIAAPIGSARPAIVRC
jgi:hypothetical protein